MRCFSLEHGGQNVVNALFFILMLTDFYNIVHLKSNILQKLNFNLFSQQLWASNKLYIVIACDRLKSLL